MALLDPIPEQNFEKARDMIAQILVSEFAVNSINPKVYTERVQEIDKSNFPAVNVVFEGLSNQSLNNSDNDGTYTFNIDCYSNGKATATTSAGSNASVSLHRLIAITKQVLLNQVYKNLLFAVNERVVLHRSITSIQTADPFQGQDSNGSVMARLVLVLKLSDVMQKDEAVTINKIVTTVRVKPGDSGFLWESNL
tara:strand:- start:5580 stop:6164 length:585 start_codon:yes stop_codon:yes gene_type:complete